MLSFAVAMPYWHWCVLPLSAAAVKKYKAAATNKKERKEEANNK